MKHASTLFILWFFTANLITAQTAPDFTVTDVDGQVHHLYADYLNQGKTVMIKIMFTTCPPCNSIAPLMEPLYQEWGAGDYDVEFFEMTDKSFDTNSLMEAYADQYDETFPAISMQGNSLPTVQPYKNGTFGPWFGTPTFLVIAPNGTVQFNVDGANNQATIDAIDAALTATGAQKPNQPVVAPDFVINDSHDQTHQLYGNYLNQGKTVLFGNFQYNLFSMHFDSTLLQPLYFEWGSGDYDVEFIQLSDKNFDSDALINNFQLNYGETFVGVGVEGGSLAAVAPYKNGQFGPWDDTPTYVVIAPDGTMQYDVHGANNNETIDAIDLALSSTGAVKPNLPLVAPDFNVKDSHGQQHLLYADYLTQGKTVLIEIFNTTCTPCMSIAPLMEPLYQDWGAGDYDVEFIELSDKNFDTDALINNYQSQYGETFIGVGKNGASLSTVVPYKSGLFGPWDQTPTFVVIAPDGTVQYDVHGATNQATIAAIDSAISATGAVKPVIEQPILINGNVHFLSGSAGVANATVQVIDSAGNVITSDISEMNGSFNLSILLSEVQPDWKLKVVKHGPPKNGVSAIDLVKIQKHLLILEPLDNPFAKLAADANNSGSISALDIIVVTKLLLGLIQNFNNGEEWITIPADTDFGPPTQHPPVIHETTIPLQDIINGTRQPNFIGIKKGDVSGNANPG